MKQKYHFLQSEGEGGMALTNDEELAWHMGTLRSHGITREPGRMTQTPEGPWYYEQLELGYNYRLTDIQAALGISQMSRIDDFIESRNLLAQVYNQQLSNLPLKLPFIRSENRSAFHLYIVRLITEKNRYVHKKIFESLREEGIGVNLHYMAVHLQPYYRKRGFTDGSFPEAERYGNEAITLPLYSNLKKDTQETVINKLINCFDN